MHIPGNGFGTEFGIFIAVGQWLVFRAALPAASRWVVMTAASVLTGEILVRPLAFSLAALVYDIVLRGTVGFGPRTLVTDGASLAATATWIGLAQTMVLPGGFGRSSWWIPASIAGWGLAWASELAFGWWAGYPSALSAVGRALVVGASGVAYAIPTGIVLAKLRGSRWT
jgi:hypothetical protein